MPAVIEPLRATDGLCGPKHNNATCLGTDKQCCNANTFTCGSTEYVYLRLYIIDGCCSLIVPSSADCAPGTCFEGACDGDTVYSTDGTCGVAHGGRLCAGKWGICCNMSGACGNGTAFCGVGSCQSGNCTQPSTTTAPVTWPTGTSPDGTCGGPSKYSCNVLYGNCCNRNGICGSLPSDCGAGW